MPYRKLPKPAPILDPVVLEHLTTAVFWVVENGIGYYEAVRQFKELLILEGTRRSPNVLQTAKQLKLNRTTLVEIKKRL